MEYTEEEHIQQSIIELIANKLNVECDANFRDEFLQLFYDIPTPSIHRGLEKLLREINGLSNHSFKYKNIKKLYPFEFRTNGWNNKKYVKNFRKVIEDLVNDFAGDENGSDKIQSEVDNDDIQSEVGSNDIQSEVDNDDLQSVVDPGDALLDNEQIVEETKETMIPSFCQFSEGYARGLYTLFSIEDDDIGKIDIDEYIESFKKIFNIAEDCSEASSARTTLNKLLEKLENIHDITILKKLLPKHYHENGKEVITAFLRAVLKGRLLTVVGKIPPQYAELSSSDDSAIGDPVYEVVIENALNYIPNHLRHRIDQSGFIAPEVIEEYIPLEDHRDSLRILFPNYEFDFVTIDMLVGELEEIAGLVDDLDDSDVNVYSALLRLCRGFDDLTPDEMKARLKSSILYYITVYRGLIE